MSDRGTPSESISVIVCTYNRAESLRLTLESLVAPSGRHDEIIVVDNNSDDHTEEVTRSFEGVLPNLRYVIEPHQGLAWARNRGIRCASGDVVAFIDDDVVVEPDWLDRIRTAFSAYPAAVVAGPVALGEMSFPDWWRDHFSLALGFLDLGDRPILYSRGHRGTRGIGGNLSFRKQVFDTCGDFNVALGRRGLHLYMGEELELCSRVLETSFSILYSPSVKVVHRCSSDRLTKRYLRRWFFRYGEWCGYASRRIGRSSPQTPERFTAETVKLWFSSTFSSELALIWFTGYVSRWLAPYRYGRRL